MIHVFMIKAVTLKKCMVHIYAFSYLYTLATLEMITKHK